MSHEAVVNLLETTEELLSQDAVVYLLKKTQDWLTNELRLPEKIKAGVRKLNDELTMMRASIKDLDSRKKQDYRIQEWIQQIRGVAYEIEIVLDMFAYQNAQENVSWFARTTGIGRHSIANLMEEAMSNLEKISDRRGAHQLDASFHSASTSSDHGAAIASLFVPEVEILGVEEPKEELLTWVHDAQRTYKVMFVVGMGGSGKSALVNRVYEQLKKDFDYNVWLTVSEFENGQKLLSHMVSKSCNPTGQSPIPYYTHKDLITKLNCDLLNKKYLIILDDLWNRNIWESVKYAFPRGNQSRVIITTRRGDIASSCRENWVDVYKVQALPIEKARDLFYRKAFSECGTYPSEQGLNESSEKLLKECEGLPLGIIEIGKLVSTREKSVFELKKLHDSLQAELTSGNLSNITQVLLLSYNELPHHLKSCFLYMSMFPAYYSVKCRMLIRLWIAEGFIEGVDGKTLEDVGEDYLKELMERNLIQASELEFYGRARTCRVHNLLHKIALSKSVAENFCTVRGNSSERIRRLAIHDREINMPDKVLYNAHTIFTSSANLNIPGGMISRMKLLKILHLDYANVDELPSGIEKLLLLKYLSLCQTRIQLIPETIGQLQHLETLNLKQTLVTALPDTLDNLEKLRHLLVCHYNIGFYVAFEAVQGFQAPTRISRLSNLQKLSFVRADTNHKLLQELQKLTQLRKLGIIDLRSSSGPFLCETIQMLTNLHSLNMTSLHRNEFLHIQQINNPPPLLARLYLKGPLEKMPDWISKLHDLVRIRLKWSRLTRSNPITILGQLPNLLELQLLDAYTEDRLDFENGTFPKLKILEIEQLEELKRIKIKRWVLQCLQKLIISKCPKLMQIPEGIEYTTELKELHLRDLPPDFVDPLRRNGQMRHLVQHIQKIYSMHLQHLQNGCQWVGGEL